jgi:hypothetical protein
MLEKVINGLAGHEQSTALIVEEFAHLYEAHITAVFNYCLFRLGEQKAAEDLAADIFERAWRDNGVWDDTADNTLLSWEADGFTYTLQSYLLGLTRDELIQIAESIR